MQTLISYLHAWGIANNDIILEPLLRPHNQHYSGAIFQVHLVDEAETGVTSLVAVGMALLAACHITHTSTTHSVGRFASLPRGATNIRHVLSANSAHYAVHSLLWFAVNSQKLKLLTDQSKPEQRMMFVAPRGRLANRSSF